MVGLVGAAVSAVAGFGLVLVVTNLYSADVAGTFFAGTSVLVLLAALSSLGTETGLARFMLRFEALGRAADIRAVISTAYRASLSLSVVLAIGLFVAADQVAELIGIAEHDGAGILRVLALTLPFIALNNLSLAGTRAFGRMRATALVDGIGRSGAQPALAILVGLAGAGVVVLTVSWALPYVVAAIVSTLLFASFVRARGLVAQGGDVTPYREVRREFWSFTWPRSITRISQMAIQRVDIVLIAAMLSPSDAAIYTAATRFVVLGQFSNQAIQQVLQPKFTQLLATDDDPQVLADVYRVSTAWCMAVTWPLYVVVGGAPVAYLDLFGQGYSDVDARLVVVIMAASMMLAVASGAADTLLLMSGRSRLSLYNSILSLTLDVGLCLLLIPAWGIVGAAAAWGVAVLTKCALAFAQARRYLGVVSIGSSGAIVAAASVGCIGLPVAALTVLADLNGLQLSLVVVLCSVAYAGVLWLGRRQLMLEVFRDLLARRRAVTETPA
jgi:O-antigen/teichoic acid export membrane protein